MHNLRTESLKQQYNLVSEVFRLNNISMTLQPHASMCPNRCNFLVEQVKERTSVHNTFNYGSHVMQYGSLDLSGQHLFTYIGSNPANDNATFVEDNSLPSFSKAVNQRDADLVYFWQKVSLSRGSYLPGLLPEDPYVLVYTQLLFHSV